MDSHAIATLDYFLAPFVWVEKWEQGGHSMGLILEARSPFLPPFLHGLFLGCPKFIGSYHGNRGIGDGKRCLVEQARLQTTFT